MRETFSPKKIKSSYWSQCLDDPVVLDLSDVHASFYNPKDTILGDLKCLGWVLLHWERIDNETQYSLDTISSSVRWHPIEDSKRLMKYTW